MAKKHTRNKADSSPLPNMAPLSEKNKATDMAIINGMVANLVNNPNIINAAQKNSANTTKANEVVDPILNGSANLLALSAK
jgi:hypothetical protein